MSHKIPTRTKRAKNNPKEPQNGHKRPKLPKVSQNVTRRPETTPIDLKWPENIPHCTKTAKFELNGLRWPHKC